MLARRAFVAGLLAGLAARPARAAPTRRVGVLVADPALVAYLIHGLREAGQDVDGEITVIRRGPAPLARDRWGPPARELAALPADVLVAGEHAALRACREATAAVPIVGIDCERDPVASGLVASLAHPGGNVTGVFLDLPAAAAQTLQLMRQALPQTAHVVALTDAVATQPQARALEAAARAAGLSFDALDVALDEVNELVDRAAAPGTVLILPFGARLEAMAPRIAKAAVTRRRLPSVALFPRFAQAGGLLGYGASLPDAFRRVAATVDRLLRGERPAELAAQRPQRFELGVNLRTARALDLALPASFLSRADQVVR